jgi:hypothetical protein
LPTIFGGIVGAPYRIPQNVVNVVVEGVVLTCVASIIPGRARGVSVTFVSGTASGDILISTKDSRPAFLYLVPGEASGTIGVSQEEIEALLLIFAEAA